MHMCIPTYSLFLIFENQGTFDMKSGPHLYYLYYSLLIIYFKDELEEIIKSEAFYLFIYP